MATKAKTKASLLAADPSDTVPGSVPLTGTQIYANMPRTDRLLLISCPEGGSVAIEYKLGMKWVRAAMHEADSLVTVTLGAGPCRIVCEGGAEFALM